MTNTDYPWEPPMAGTEAAHLTGALDRLRTTFRFKADDLDAAGLQVRVGASALTLGGLLKHLAVCEDYMFTVKLSGAPIGAPWEGADWEGDNDWELTSAAGDTPEQLYDLWDGAVERSRARLSAALASGGLDQSVHLTHPDGRHASLRRLVWVRTRPPDGARRPATIASMADARASASAVPARPPGRVPGQHPA